MTADARDTAHLVTGTLDTTGYGEGDLRDVALVYRNPFPEPETADAEPSPEPPGDDPLTPEPLFTADGEPSARALPEPAAPQIGQQVLDSSAQDDQPPAAAGDDPSRTPPVEDGAHADKESKTPVGAKARRGKTAG